MRGCSLPFHLLGRFHIFQKPHVVFFAAEVFLGEEARRAGREQSMVSHISRALLVHVSSTDIACLADVLQEIAGRAPHNRARSVYKTPSILFRRTYAYP